jgi:hypothetical protein
VSGVAGLGVCKQIVLLAPRWLDTNPAVYISGRWLPMADAAPLLLLWLLLTLCTSCCC